jgi:parallel beta-helix repeat protein
MLFAATFTWSGNEEITSDFTVGATDTLIIEPGTLVRFAPEVKLIINGEIRSLGTAAGPVSFTYLSGSDTQWGGVIISSMSMNNEFNYTNFSYMNPLFQTGFAGMTITESTVNMAYCRFTNNTGDLNGGAVKISGGSVTINDSYFYNNYAAEGGAVKIAGMSMNPCTVDINKCIFESNTGESTGGAIHIFDDYMSLSTTEINITFSDFISNSSGSGGAIFYQNEGFIDAEISKCRFISNSSSSGTAIYAAFMMTMPGNIPVQNFSNLLIYKNRGMIQSGIFIDMANTQNPSNLKFTNSTVAYNSVMMAKSKQDNTSGLYIRSNGNYPIIENTILWGNTDNSSVPSNFWIEDLTNPVLSDIFKYCDIENDSIGGTNLMLNPLFINPPLNSFMESFDIDKYDMHESVLSPCVNAGDPALNDPDGSRLNIGAYGGTFEAATSYYLITDDFNIPDNSSGVLSVDGGYLYLDSIKLGVNSHIYINSCENTEFFVKSLITQPPGKFDGYSSIEPLRVDAESPMISHSFTVSENLQLYKTKLYNIGLKVRKNANRTTVIVNGINSFSDTFNLYPFSLELVDPDYTVIENSKFSGCIEGGIRISTIYKSSSGENKAAGRLANNSISFDTDIASKDAKAVSRIGIETSSAHFDIEGNTIEGGDAGIAVKNNSGGRISNNSISFDTDIASKKDILYKTGIRVSDNSVSDEISYNRITSSDCENTNVTGIEINEGNASVMYNTISFDGSFPGAMRAGIKLVNPTDTVNVVNNTVFNTLQAFFIINSIAPVPINFINNIYWSDITPCLTVNDTTKVSFFNNCFIDSTGVTGKNNIFIYPELNAAWKGDFTLASTSPCINSGMIIDGVHSFSEGKTFYYYGNAPEMGAYEFFQDQLVPENITTSVNGTDFIFSWNYLPGYSYYKVYASETPYENFTCIASVSGLSYTASINSAMKFYYVTASTEAKTFNLTATSTKSKPVSKKSKNK